MKSALQNRSYLWFLRKTGCCTCHKRQPHVVQLAPEHQPLTETLHSSCLLLAAAPMNAPCALETTLCIYEPQVLPVVLAAAGQCTCKHQASQELCQEYDKPICPVPKMAVLSGSTGIIAQHSTAQHSTAQHTMQQRSTAQHTCRSVPGRAGSTIASGPWALTTR